MGNSFIERKLAEENWPVGDEYIMFKDGPLAGIKFVQSVAVPEDRVLIHPFVVATILNNYPEGQAIEIIKQKG